MISPCFSIFLNISLYFSFFPKELYNAVGMTGIYAEAWAHRRSPENLLFWFESICTAINGFSFPGKRFCLPCDIADYAMCYVLIQRCKTGDNVGHAAPRRITFVNETLYTIN